MIQDCSLLQKSEQVIFFCWISNYSVRSDLPTYFFSEVLGPALTTQKGQLCEVISVLKWKVIILKAPLQQEWVVSQAQHWTFVVHEWSCTMWGKVERKQQLNTEHKSINQKELMLLSNQQKSWMWLIWAVGKYCFPLKATQKKQVIRLFPTCTKQTSSWNVAPADCGFSEQHGQSRITFIACIVLHGANWRNRFPGQNLHLNWSDLEKNKYIVIIDALR